MFRFCKTFCSEFSIVNTKQNVHFATKNRDSLSNYLYLICLLLGYHKLYIQKF